MKRQPPIDDTDRKILNALLKDARCNFSEIAEDCKISTVAVAQRYKKLKQNGTITGTTLIMNPKNQRSLSIDIRAEVNREDAILDTLKKLPHILNCFKVFGGYDIHASVRVNSLEEMAQIKNMIKKEKGIIAFEIASSLDEVFLFPENLLKTE
jgi:Lrp/AsnC family transcriptional regulator, regulator for asnA, asnC and gidA